MRILVVEDDKDVAGFVVRGLREAGHVVEHADNGRDGLLLAARNRPSRPLSACSTTWPASRSPRTTKPATSLSSSTTRMRIHSSSACLLFCRPPPDVNRYFDLASLATNGNAHIVARRH